MALPALGAQPCMMTDATWAPMLDVAPLSMSRLSLLVDLASLLAREVDLDALLGTACERLAQTMNADRATIWLVDAEQGDLVTRVAVLPELPALRQPQGKGIAGYVARSGEVVRVDDASRDARFDPSADKATGYTTRSMLVAPIREDLRAPVRGVVQLLNKQGGPFDDEDERYLVALSSQLARALSMTTLRAADGGNPGLVLQGPFNRIVGRSPAITAVYEKIQLAAQTDATVLLRGETGSGKGLFARAIHVNSRRQARPFVTVDCTTLPAQLVESELFGHERGAFTGADRRVPGKVELSEGGTLFLDELGDLPLDIQGKLLRFLQDRTFERVGGRSTLRADVRIVCATHRDLETAVAEGRFREDLYYRVRVVEIELPPLRVRGREEIESLARHFADVYAQRYGRPSPSFDPTALHAIATHSWPGNVRELEHWIESAIALAPDGRVTTSHLPQRKPRTLPGIEPPASNPGIVATDSTDGEIKLSLGLSLDDAVERYVSAVVDACGGNKTEAARRLGVGRNTIARALARHTVPASRGSSSGTNED
jgi:transcriptional regulator with GAF, ATPase, and Fis domain